MRNSHPVEISGLTKSYGDVNAVDDLSLVVKTGEVHGPLGPNSAGNPVFIQHRLARAQSRRDIASSE